MHQTADRSHFASEPLDRNRIALQRRPHDFERNRLLLFKVCRHINEPHAASGNQAFYSETVTKDVTGFEIRSGIMFFQMFCSNHI